MSSSSFKDQAGPKRILNVTGYSLIGFFVAFRDEVAFRQLMLPNMMLIPAVLLPGASRGECVLMTAVCLLAPIIGLLNSTVEATTDRISLECHPLSKNAKGMGGATQSVASTMAAVIWAAILLG